MYPDIEDYRNPRKDYILPGIPLIVLKKLGISQKPLVLKSNIIEKNKLNHKEVLLEDYNQILYDGIQNVDIVLKTCEDDEYFNFIHIDEELNIQILIELSEKKTQYEIVNFYKISKKSLKNRVKKALKKELITRCGHILIT
mgnify:CR=1 FL=1